MRRLNHQVSALVFLGIAVCVTLLCLKTTATAILGSPSQSQSLQAPAPAITEEGKAVTFVARDGSRLLRVTFALN